MTLLTEPTRIVLAKDYIRPDDADAVAYIAAVEAADGQALETATRMAINSFVKGCKADGIWPAIKASCILAGARTLTGALVPLAGTAPTSFNFVDGDYNRKTGLKGDGSTKYLNSNYAFNSGNQNNAHVSVYIAEQESLKAAEFIGNSAFSAHLTRAGNGVDYVSRMNSSVFGTVTSAALGMLASSRNNSTVFSFRVGQSTTLVTASSGPVNGNLFAVYDAYNASRRSNARLAFYSIGESLDLALLDARVTDLINAFGVAIP